MKWKGENGALLSAAAEGAVKTYFATLGANS